MQVLVSVLIGKVRELAELDKMDEELDNLDDLIAVQTPLWKYFQLQWGFVFFEGKGSWPEVGQLGQWGPGPLVTKIKIRQFNFELTFNPFLPDCKTTFSWIFKIFLYAIFKFLRSEHDCYAKFTSCST